MKYFLKKLMGHEIFRSMVSPSYMLNVRSLKGKILQSPDILYISIPEKVTKCLQDLS